MPTPTRILAEQLIGIEALAKLDHAGIMLIPRTTMRSRQRLLIWLRQVLRKLLCHRSDPLPFGEVCGFVDCPLCIPRIVPGCAHEDIIGCGLGGVVTPQALVADEQNPPAPSVRDDAEHAEAAAVAELHSAPPAEILTRE